MNDGPPAKRSDTQSPFAVLSPEVGRGQTGTRVKITETEDPEEALGDSGGMSSSIPPEALKKPFSSLSPNKPFTSPGPSPAVGAPPPPPSQLFAQTSMRPGGTSQTARTSIAPRREGTATTRYGTCKEHGTALTSEGKCVLCAREEAKKAAQRSSRVFYLLAIVLLGAAAFAILQFLSQ